jgi:hypothetical protein
VSLEEVSLDAVSPAVPSSPEEADVSSPDVVPVESLLPQAASETVIAATSKADITFFFILFLSFFKEYILYKMRHCILYLVHYEGICDISRTPISKSWNILVKFPKTYCHYNTHFVIMQARPVVYYNFRFFSYPIFILEPAEIIVNAFSAPKCIFATLYGFDEFILWIITRQICYFFENNRRSIDSVF